MRTLLAVLLLPLSLLGLLAVFVGAFFLTLPNVSLMSDCMVTSMNGVKLCPKDPGYTPYTQVSPHVINAIVASEDAAFFHHGGFDWHELRESFTKNIREKGYKRGGSTITQQLAKNVFLEKEKSILRKLREAAITIDIERQYDKKQILERYMNVVEFGPNIFGIRAAARHYFGKAPSELHVLEASYLAHLLPNPKVYSRTFAQGSLTPFSKKIVMTILYRLEGFKKISSDTLNVALARVDEFPWTAVSTGDLSGLEPISDSPSSSELIQNFLSRENEAALPVEEDDVPPEEDSSTWD